MLLNAQWEMGALPDDQRRLAGIIGAQFSEFEAVWPQVSRKFQSTPDGLLNRRMEEHRAHQAERSEKARESARARWGERADPDANADANADADASSSHGKTDANGHALGMRNGCSSSPSPSSSSLGVSGGNSRPRSRTGPAFHREVIAAYHELLPDLPQVKVWSHKRRESLNARIRERSADGKAANEITYWRSLFQHVAASDFLCGRKTDFRADLEWLLRPENFAKVIEGRYDNRPNGATRAR